jgi:mRNA-degrading endonuclease toxin of MazEF toxin-antitoxin module
MKQGEIWQIGLDPTIGAEMKKSRPALIINVDDLGKLTSGNGIAGMGCVRTPA